MKKTYENISRKHLSFAKKYGYNFKYIWDPPYQKIILSNENTNILFLELPQFYEKYLYVSRADITKEIDISKFKSRSIKTNDEYWTLISNSLQYYLNNNIDLMSILKLE